MDDVAGDVGDDFDGFEEEAQGVGLEGDFDFAGGAGQDGAFFPGDGGAAAGSADVADEEGDAARVGETERGFALGVVGEGAQVEGVLFKTDGGGRRRGCPVFVVGLKEEKEDSPCPEEQEERNEVDLFLFHRVTSLGL